MKLLIYLSFSLLILYSCKKDKDENTSDASAILSPQENDTIKGGIEFPIKGSITSTLELQGYTIEVYNENADSVLYKNTVSEKNTNYAVNQLVKHSMDTLTDLKMKLIIFATSGEQAKHEYQFYYKP